MITIRARNALAICLLLLAAACSREQQDWRSAEAADTIEAYGRFIERHPESELVTQARMRVTQLEEEQDWQQAGSADTAEAYGDFIAKHPNGKWTQEARIRIDNFSLAANGEGVSAVATPGRAGGGAPVAVAPNTEPAVAPNVEATPSPPVAAAGHPALAVAGEAAAPPTAPAGQARPTVQPAAAVQPSASGGPSPATVQPGAASQPAVAAAPHIAVAPNTEPTAAPKVAASAGGDYGIQLGAFSTEASATNQWHALTARFGPELQGLQEHIVAADTPSGRIYRLQAGVGPEARARAICESLRKQAQPCVAVLPR
jgi:hypothetical protein